MEESNNKIILRTEKILQKHKWEVLATSRKKEGRDLISEILKKFNLENIFYHPNVLVGKDNMKLFLIFSEKSKFPISTKKGEQRIVSGIDYFKYGLSQYIESVTGIQVGLIMYSRETNDLIIRQMNQLPKPIAWFSSEGCLLNALRLSYKKPTEKRERRVSKVYSDGVSNQETIELDEIKKQLSGQLKVKEYNSLPFLKCIKCYQRFPSTCYRCVKGKHKSIKVFAIWDVEEFERKKLTIQLPLLSYGGKK